MCGRPVIVAVRKRFETTHAFIGQVDTKGEGVPAELG
jgi:hypothetical protein